MEKLISCKEAATAWNVTERWISILCKNGKIEGAVKQGHRWMIPAGTPKPADSRVRTGIYRKNITPSNLSLPVGISDFKKASTEYYYVDKTALIKQLLDQKPLVSVFTRPRRFGKTLALDMLRVFFEKSAEDTSVYFQNKAIWSYGARYQEQQGQYPVIYLSFRNLRGDSFQQMQERIRFLIRQEYARHEELAETERFSSLDRELYRSILSGVMNEGDLISSLHLLCSFLYKNSGTAPVLLIDEYDAPVFHAMEKGYSEELLAFFQNLYTETFKDNQELSFAVLTGTSPIRQERIFGDFRNARFFTVTDMAFQSCFGFTNEELAPLCEYYHAEQHLDEIRVWYGGYQFGDVEITNPCSVMDDLSDGFTHRSSWPSSRDSEMIRQCFSLLSHGSMEHIRRLIGEETVTTQVDDFLDPAAEMTLSASYGQLLARGYLSVLSRRLLGTGFCMSQISLPGKEVNAFLRKELLSFLSAVGALPASSVSVLQEALFVDDALRFQNAIKKILQESLSGRKSADEEYFQLLYTGLYVVLDGYFEIKAQRETANGRLIFQLIPEDTSLQETQFEITSQKIVRFMYGSH